MIALVALVPSAALVSQVSLVPLGTDVLAHGVGSRNDLPIPAFYAFAAALAALFISFLGLAILWPESRFRGATAGIPLRRATALVDSRAARLLLRLLGIALVLFTIGWLLLGPDDPQRNPAPWLVYVVFWVGLVPLSLAFGPVWRVLNPLRTLTDLVVRLLPTMSFRTLPSWVGYRPAAIGLLGFAWVELVAPEPASRATLLWFLGLYAAVQVAGSLVFGARWFERCDAFEAYSSLIGRLSFVGRRADGRLVVRSPFNGLDSVTPAPGLVATVCVLLGSTAYDGFSGSPFWVAYVQTAPLGRIATGTLGLMGAIAIVAGLYGVCVGLARGRPADFAHTLIPIVVGYLVAHYFSLLVVDGQRAIALSLGRPADAIDDTLLSPGTIATVQVSAIVVGHLLGVVAAHDRAVRRLPPERAVSGQIPLFVLMVCYTLTGLALLFAT